MFAGLSWQDMAIDLGTANTVIFLKGQGIVFCEPSVVAIDKETGEIVGVGSAAKDIECMPDNIEIIKPLQGGVVADFETTKEMLSYFIHKAQLQRRGFGSLLRPRMVVCVPSGITSVELWAVREIAESVGARQAYSIEEPLAAAIGAGLPVNKAQGSIVVSLGAGTSEAAVISLGGIVTRSSIRIAGDDMDYAISWYIQNEHEIAIDTQTAEQLKMKLGSALEMEHEESAEVTGEDLDTGLSRTVVVTSGEVREVISVHLDAIAVAIRDTLSRTPPELASDILELGIILTGGGGLLRLLDERLRQEMGLPVHVADAPLRCAALGSGRCLEKPEYYPNAFTSS